MYSTPASSSCQCRQPRLDHIPRLLVLPMLHSQEGLMEEHLVVTPNFTGTLPALAMLYQIVTRYGPQAAADLLVHLSTSSTMIPFSTYFASIDQFS
jgi:hypothetical protein